MGSEYVFRQPEINAQIATAVSKGEDVGARIRRSYESESSTGLSERSPQTIELARSLGASAGLTLVLRDGNVWASGSKLSMAILGGLFLKDAAERSSLTHSGTLETFTTSPAVTGFRAEAPSRSSESPVSEADKRKTDAKLPGLEQTKSLEDRPANQEAKTERDLTSAWRKVQNSLEQAANNRGRETNAFKSLHDFLKAISASSMSDSAKQQTYDHALALLSKIKDWDKPQWLRREPSSLRDAQGRRTSEYDAIRARNNMSNAQMKPWDEWAKTETSQFKPSESAPVDKKLSDLDDYLVRRVSVDSVKNWLRRRPDEQFVNNMFAALAQNKLYMDEPNLRIRSLKDDEGKVRAVELRDGKLYFEGSDEEAPIKSDERGRYVELPDDSDMVIFERRTVAGRKLVVPISQPNDRDPNIQWFGGPQVKRGWAKEQRFFDGPQAFSIEELYGFFPDHFPMRVTNSTEAGKPTQKTGAAIYGYARDHAGRQARQLIAECGEVMDGLKRNNSQLINDTRVALGLQKPSHNHGRPGAAPTLEFDSPYPAKTT